MKTCAKLNDNRVYPAQPGWGFAENCESRVIGPGKQAEGIVMRGVCGDWRRKRRAVWLSRGFLGPMSDSLTHQVNPPGTSSHPLRRG